MSKRLEGLTAVVTGGGGGCGSEVALGLAAEGARVLVNDFGTDAWGRSSGEPRAQKVVDEIRARGGEAIADTGDIGNFEQARGIIDTAIEAWGKLDILVNAAGTIRLGTISDTSPADLSSQLHVHLTGYYNTAHHAAQHWIERGEYGRLINFTSSAGWRESFPTLLAYGAAKAGTWGLTRACANALAVYNVTANAFAPNAATPTMGDAMVHAQRILRETGIPESQHEKGRTRDPVHCVPLLIALASPESSHVSGRLFMGQGDRYRLMTDIGVAREVNANFLTDPEGTYEVIQSDLLGDLTLENLDKPIDRFEVIGRDWATAHGVEPPYVDISDRATR